MGAEYQSKGIELPWDAYKDADDYGSGSARGASGTPGDDYPAWYINWFGAAYYCNALSKAHGLDTVYNYASHGWNEVSRDVMTDVQADYSKDGFRLPTEAEWEYACRAGTKTKYFWGEDATPVAVAHNGYVPRFVQGASRPKRSCTARRDGLRAAKSFCGTAAGAW